MYGWATRGTIKTTCSELKYRCHYDGPGTDGAAGLSENCGWCDKFPFRSPERAKITATIDRITMYKITLAITICPAN